MKKESESNRDLERGVEKERERNAQWNSASHYNMTSSNGHLIG